MTENMIKAMQELCTNLEQEAYLQYSTANALESRGLVNVGKIPKSQITESGNFPQYLTKLTEKGKLYCENNLVKKIT